MHLFGCASTFVRTSVTRSPPWTWKLALVILTHCYYTVIFLQVKDIMRNLLQHTEQMNDRSEHHRGDTASRRWYSSKEQFQRTSIRTNGPLTWSTGFISFNRAKTDSILIFIILARPSNFMNDCLHPAHHFACLSFLAAGCAALFISAPFFGDP